MTRSLQIILCILFVLSANAQEYSQQDSIRGSITPERSWWDLSYYHLNVAVDINQQSLQGSNTIKYKVLKSSDIMQIDLQPPMEISKVTQDGNPLTYKREGNAFFIQLEKEQVANRIEQIKIYFNGKPRVAPRPPWDSGMVWEKDSLGNPFVASVSWGAGSSLWWPCKDHMYDEVDSLKFSINVDKDLVAVGNGKLLKVEKKKNKTKTYQWFVSNPISNYVVNFNVANYANFGETYQGENGALQCDYYVLKQHLKKAKIHFKQVPMMLEAFEYWFGPYPFYEDGYKLVEVPYSGMEHQSAVTYGNDYSNGWYGNDIHQSGYADKFDFIIVHESGHEWFANNITFKDIADIWIHESFTCYSEGLYVEYHYGKEAGNTYQKSLRKEISNEVPIIGDYDVNDSNYSGDVYVKGASVLHMLRQLVNDDEKWRNILRGLNEKFYHKTVTTAMIENYISKASGLDLTVFWDQYLRTTQIPVFEYHFFKGQLSYRWTNCLKDFAMPVKVMVNENEMWLTPTKSWKSEAISADSLDLEVDPNFYVPSFYSNAK